MQSMDMQSFSVRIRFFFYKQLVYMLKGGVSILQAVETTNNLLPIMRSKRLRLLSFSTSMRERVFSYALSRLPEYFDESDASIVKTGENTGNLDVVLQELANEYTYLESIKNRYKSALTYPVILIIMAVGAVLFLVF